MIQTKDHAECGDRILLFFGQKACARRRLSGALEEQRLILLSDELMLAQNLELIISRRESKYFIGDKELSGQHPFYFYTAQKEKLLLIVTGRLERISQGDRLFLPCEEVCVIGNAFQNRVFYDCCGLVGPNHVQIGYKEDGISIHSAGKEGVYVNERLLTEEKELKTGDRVDIYGLHILVLKGFFLCNCFFGISRLSGSAADMRLFGADKGRVKISEKVSADENTCLIERRWNKEQQLHEDSVEILAPALRVREGSEPLALSLGPSVTMVIPMLVMAFLGTSLGQGSSFYLLSVAMGMCSAALALFWGAVQYGYRRHDGGRCEKQRVLEYREYLQRMREYLNTCAEENRRILEQRYPRADTFLEDRNIPPKVLWNRYDKQKDFWFLRLGMGKTQFQMKVALAQKSNKIVPDLLFKEGEDLVKEFQFIGQVPVGVDFQEVRQLGLLADPNRPESYEILYQMLVQLAACHCYTEMKVVCFFDKEILWQKQLAQGIGWMPHSWSKDKKTRYLAGDEGESAQILPVLTQELERGRDKKEDGGLWYLALVLNDKLVSGELIYQYLTDSEKGRRVSTVFMGRTRAQMPKSCRGYLDCFQEKEMVVPSGDGLYRQEINIERLTREQAEGYFRSISGFRAIQNGLEEQIPEKMDFLELYGCGRAEELHIVQRWRRNQPAERMKVPIGCGAGGIVSLDIHEKFHGPHGLIAGTTGSGKSELLLTFLLSIMVNFSPEDVNFFMIDYKGGGTGNVLQNLPHCAGIISNLSGNQIKRAMSAITSENKRRQELLGRYGVNHIDAYTGLYRENKAKEPLPHLILVVDEFAQLRKEEPEFMQEMISLSQVGRSLGIHLILATQKPGGTVDDRIWSNARFHLCLKVQDRQDSMDMLHNGDAAYLTAPGQCYLQIGANEYYALFQTGYCSGSYIPRRNREENTALVEGTGKRLCLPQESRGQQSQLEAVADQIKLAARREHSILAKALWMPELPDQILLRELKKTVHSMTGEDAGGANARKGHMLLLGLCDDPENQRQFPLVYDPVEMGHMAVCGGPLTGKSNLLQLLLQQILLQYTPDQARVLGVDMSQESMEVFRGLPGTLGILQEKENKDIFFYHLEKLFKRKDHAPLIFLVIDNIASLFKELEEGQTELLFRLAAQGMGCGIYLIFSASSPSEIPGKIFEKIKTTLALEMSDRFAYGDVLRQYSLPVLPKENTRGRGLCRAEGRVLEFQAAACMEKEEFLKEEAAFNSVKEETDRKIPVFPEIPRRPEYGVMKEKYRWRQNSIPLGYSLADGEIKELNLEQKYCFLVSDSGGRRGKKFLENMAESLLFLKKRVIWMGEDHLASGLMEEKEFVCIPREEFVSCHQRISEEACVLIPDIRSFVKTIESMDSVREERMAFWEEIAMGNKRQALLAGCYDPLGEGYLLTEGFFRALADHQTGIHLGGNPSAQRVFSFDDLGYAGLNRHEAEDTGYWKADGVSRTQRLLIPGIREEGI